MRFDELTVGDRFNYLGKLWTKTDSDSARQHSAASLALESGGYGYNGDPWCSVDRHEEVEFVPPAPQWVNVKNGLPKEIVIDGTVNCVLAMWKEDRLDGCIPNPNICNTTYFNLHTDEFTSWMYIPAQVQTLNDKPAQAIAGADKVPDGHQSWFATNRTHEECSGCKFQFAAQTPCDPRGHAAGPTSCKHFNCKPWEVE